MFFSRLTSQSTATFSKQIAKLRAALDASDAVIIGAGAGLSTAAGYAYAGERFEKLFGDFAARYGFTDMYSGGFYPYDSLEEYWAFWSRYIICNRYDPIPKPIYEQLLGLLRDRDYFVLTTNVDHCFQRAGFDKQRLFYTQGDYVYSSAASPAVRKLGTTKARTLHGRRPRRPSHSVCASAPLPPLWLPAHDEPARRRYVCAG